MAVVKMGSKVQVMKIENFTRLPLFILKFVGFSVQHRSSIKTRIFFWAVNANFLLGLVTLIMKFVKESGDRSKFQDMIFTAQQLSYLLLAFAKSFGLIFINGGYLEAIFIDLDRILRESNDEQLHTDIANLLRRLRLTWRIIFAFYLFANTVKMLEPLVAMMIEWLTDEQIELELPFKAWFPVDQRKFFFYIICYCQQGWVAVSMICFMVGSDCMFSTLISIVRVRFYGLERDIRKAKTYEEIRHFVEKHLALIRVCENLEKIFSPLILFNILVASIIICFQAYMLTVSEL